MVDAGFLPITQAMHVDGHSSHVSARTNNNGVSRDTSYNLKLVDGRVDSCTVGYSAYNKLNDGDAVTVKFSRLLKRCISIDRAGEVVYAEQYWKVFSVIIGAVLIVLAFGKLEFENSGWSWN